MITLVSGGTGTPKLLDGARDVVDEGGISVVVNTGDDIEIAGNIVCPDVDTVLYTLSDAIDREKWWGVENDTYATHESLVEDGERVERVESPRRISRWRAFSGIGEFMRIGDRDRATHIRRTSLIDSGATLTEATRRLADSMGIDADVLPMSDDPVATYDETPEGEMQFQEFWVARGAEPDVEAVEFRGSDDAEATDEVLDALEKPVVIGPSNPVTSVGPVLELDGVRERLAETRVVAVSPFVGGEVVSGPAAELMRAVGLEPSSEGVYDAYSEFLDVLVVDGEEVSGCETVELDTLIDSRDDARRLSKRVLELV